MTTATSQRSKSSAAYAFLGIALVAVIGNFAARDQVSAFQQQLIDIAAPAIIAGKGKMDFAAQKLEALAQLFSTQDEITKLHAENERLKAWYQTALMLQSENAALKSLLNVSQSDVKAFVTTRVIADGSSTYAKSLLIDAGGGNGVQKGQGVVSHDGLVGRVVEAGDRTARVLLLQDMNSRIPVIVEETGERAILAGNNTSTPSLEHLPEGYKVKAGQRVITSGLGGLFPYGIAVGETYASDEGRIMVRLFADPEKSQHIQVVDYGTRPTLAAEPSFAAIAPDAPSRSIER